MTFEQAIEKYGPITNGIWPNETLYCSLLRIPPDIADNWINSITGAQTKNIYCNIDMHLPLLKALQNVRDRGMLPELKTFDGALCIRNVRGESSRLSSHSYGISIDINAGTNKLGETGDMPQQLADCFIAAGFVWGRTFRRTDSMHFSLGTW